MIIIGIAHQMNSSFGLPSSSGWYLAFLLLARYLYAKTASSQKTGTITISDNAVVKTMRSFWRLAISPAGLKTSKEAFLEAIATKPTKVIKMPSPTRTLYFSLILSG